MYKKKGIDLARFILEEERRYPHATGTLSHALLAIENAGKVISAHINKAGLVDILGRAEKINIYGEDVKKLDELANKWLIEHLSASGDFFAIASEELEEPVFPEVGKDGKYVILLDPLDGSSNIDVNISVGTIFSIFKKISDDVTTFFQEGYKQVAAGYIIYGSSTMMVYTTGNGVHGFTLDPMIGTFILSHPDIKIPSKGKIYSINEAYYLRWDGRIRNWLDTIKQNRYSLRYVGSMVADVHRTLLKGGVFAYPADSKNKNGKLRLLYEAFPMSFIIEQAGGMSTNGEKSILQIKPTELHQRTPVFLGSPEDIKELLNFLN
ncbi:class 1 fructose-bisphosphatase [Thermodesulfobacterium hydrogeniphilum]|uniref:class 1 fructose-bisphosphatase n=1 Tax=Thermodesulfobacterium hydrogeniphilum TaxID=161156 RepID=UPI00057132F2|nr:class 1 fructose-bisphosphatase [Thermodesulfobacterium hydrogeniphilum]